ncbi:arylamine N-acetyltransferase family protein [Gordonia sp. (in: high G+C Gram-positive bacteria)]|uniref:arylamine N-acetyltransferase family protein n=1 Tax=Gordonia sp. (in: high G+C Gram-positive bacteria) TaxID=84139 RepID=UPI0039E25037
MGEWHGAELDLAALLTRIGFDGEPEPTLSTLAALHRAYTTTMPFENLDIFLGRPIPLGIAELQDKLVQRRRGGYCFEHATLFAAALEALGFRFTAALGRVSMGAAEPMHRPATHALLVVEFDDSRRCLCDVGFGRGPLEPIPVEDGTEVDQEGWRLRLTRDADGPRGSAQAWTLWQRSEVDGAVGWIDRHRWTLDQRHPVDFAVGNHYVSTSPRSPFTMRPFVQRFLPDRQETLDGRTWTTVAPDGSVTAQRTVEIEEFPQILDERFDVELTDTEATDLVAVLPGLPWMRESAAAR